MEKAGGGGGGDGEEFSSRMNFFSVIISLV